MTSTQTTTDTTQTSTDRQPPASTVAAGSLRDTILRTIAKKTFCTLATTSPASRPHVAGVVYEAVDGTLWVHAERTSRKARNLAVNPHAAVCVPYRRLPFGPPFTIHFQATATIVAMDHPDARRLLDEGRLAKISGHGALEMPTGCFIRIRPTGAIHSFGPGARILDLARDPLTSGARHFRLDEDGTEQR